MNQNVQEENNDRISSAISASRDVFERLPGVVIVNSVPDGTVLYMSQKGLQLLGTTLEEVIQMGSDYYSKFFNPEQAKEYLPGMFNLINNNDLSETYTFFQQVKLSTSNEWTWHLSSIRIFVRDSANNPIAVVVISQPIQPDYHSPALVSRLLGDLTFIRAHQSTFSTLGNQEKKILGLLGRGLTSAQIAEILNISINTAETHRKNIRKKLGVKSLVDLSTYARAFDLL